MNKSALHSSCCYAILMVTMCCMVSADEATDRRMEALQNVLSNVGKKQTITNSTTKKTSQPKKPTQKPSATKPSKTSQQLTGPRISWSPRGSFSQVGCIGSVVFGPRSLVARYDGAQNKHTKTLKVAWTYNNSAKPIASNVCKPHTNTSLYDSGISNTAAPLQPGTYIARYYDGNQIVASAQIIISQPEPLGQRNLEALSRDIRDTIQQAINEVSAARASSAADHCKRVLPTISTAMFVNPSSKDMQAMYELANAIIALHNLETVAEAKSVMASLDWCTRAQGHASLAYDLAQDTKLKATAREYATMLQQTMEQITALANKKG